METTGSQPQDRPGFSPPPQFRAGVPDDLRVPWGWLDVALFVIFGVIASVIITWGLVQVAVRFFGANPTDVFGDSMSTAKSVVLLISQALLDAGAILYLYRDASVRTPAPFWRTIGWRKIRPDVGTFAHRPCNFWPAARCWLWWFLLWAAFSIRRKRCRSNSFCRRGSA